MPQAFGPVAHGLFGLYLISLLALPRAPTSIAGLACLAGLAAGFHQWRDDARAGFRHMAVLVVPAAVYLMHIVLQILAGVAAPHLASQVLIGLLTLALGLSGVPGRLPDVRRWILPAAALGAIASCLLALYQLWVLDILRPYGWLGGAAIGNGAIKFGDLSAVQALLAFVLVLTAADKARRLLGLLGLFCGVLALALTQTRGGILGLLLAVGVLGWALSARRWSNATDRDRNDYPGHDPGHHAEPVRQGKAVPVTASPVKRGGHRRATSLAVMALAVLLSLSAAAFMQDRFASIEPQVQRYLRGDIDSEVGQRLALWRAALLAGIHQPLTGVGFGRFENELKRQSAAGLTPASEKILYGQAHSEYLSAFAEAGVTGFVALTLMFVAPMIAMLRQIRAGRGSPAALAALVTSAAFAGFALTDDMFDRQITVIAFFFLNAWFLRAAWGPGSGSETAGARPAPRRPPEVAG